MSISFIINEEHPRFVRLSCHGRYTRDSLLSLFDQAIDIAISKSREAVLVEVWAVTGTPADVFDRYQIGVGAARIQREKRPLVTIALVGDQPMIHPSRIGEIVFLNRGGVGRVFTDVEDAIAWLKARAE